MTGLARDVRIEAPAVGRPIIPIAVASDVSGLSLHDRVLDLLRKHVQRTRPLIVSGRRGCSRVPDIAQHRWKDGRDVGKAADPSLSRVVTDAAHADHVKGDVIGLHATQPSYGCAGDNS